jgi:type II secretory pathway pseudopilin PulG
MKLSLKFRHSAAFSVVEVLVVMGVIILLAGISFGMIAGIQSARMKSIAQAEIILIERALANFNAEYGDYPITEGIENNAITLSKALLGWKNFQRKSNKMVDLTDIPYDGIQAFIDPSKFIYQGEMPKSSEEMPRNIKLVDPWGQPYVYAYKDSEEWDNFSFVLYSKGPDSSDTPLPKDGVINNSFKKLAKNIDNIYLEN